VAGTSLNELPCICVGTKSVFLLEICFIFRIPAIQYNQIFQSINEREKKESDKLFNMRERKKQLVKMI